MPLQNRVQPTGNVIVDPTYGRYMGNRGILHGSARDLGTARWKHKAWVTCVLSFKNRRRALMRPGNYTELFFFDEAVAFAAGHRPCGECRRADYLRFRDAAGINGRIKDYDTGLHEDRAIPRVFRQRRHMAEISDLPDGVFILGEGERPHLVLQNALLPFEPSGYGMPRKRPISGAITVLTPSLLVNVLKEGYQLDIAAQI